MAMIAITTRSSMRVKPVDDGNELLSTVGLGEIRLVSVFMWGTSDCTFSASTKISRQFAALRVQTKYESFLVASGFVCV